MWDIAGTDLERMKQRDDLENDKEEQCVAVGQSCREKACGYNYVQYSGVAF